MGTQDKLDAIRGFLRWRDGVEGFLTADEAVREYGKHLLEEERAIAIADTITILEEAEFSDPVTARDAVEAARRTLEQIR
jgi:hypothetical protein